MMKYFTKRWNLYKGKKRLNLLKNEVTGLYVNQELFAFLQNLTNLLKSKDEKLYYLQFCKKTILQIRRFPDRNHYEAFKEEYDLFFSAIRKEQQQYNPIRWIDAELEFLQTAFIGKTPTSEPIDEKPRRDWMTTAEMEQRLGTSKMALRRRMAEGMPFTKLGNQLRFDPNLVDAWLLAQN
ncbi:hypothetical protein [Parapedobacter sp. 2B3]|uniref:hypothetical protein n=1 Tax=Parapedobacter sp. 2B3 TaxID=3342381 RepID=UPI0035B66677